MNVPQDELNLWRRFFNQAYTTIQQARQEVAAGRVAQADQLLLLTVDASVRMGIRLERAGADPIGPPAQSLSDVPEIPLHLLDTPANRRYLGLLRDTYEAALAVDRERFGEDIGTDGCAQAIEIVLRDVEEEVHGPAGRLAE